MIRQAMLRLCTSILILSTLTACGSGGDGTRNTKPTAKVTAASSNVLEGDEVVLQATGTDKDGEVTHFEWRQESGPAIEVTRNVAGNYSFRVPDINSHARVVVQVRVFDDSGTASDWVSHSVQVRPAASLIVRPPADIDGSFVVTDDNGTTLSLSHRAQAQFERRYAEFAPFSLTLTSHPEKMSCWLTEAQGTFGTGNMISDIQCNRFPEVTGLSSVSVQFGAPVVISPVITDQDSEALTYYWVQVRGHAVDIEDTTSQSLEFTAPMLTTLETLGFNLVVSDDVNEPLVLPLEVTVLPPLTMGFNVSGLNGELVVENQTNEEITVSANGLHLFESQFRVGENYALGIVSAPLTQDCTIENGSGVFSGGEQVFPQVNCNTMPEVQLTGPDAALHGDTLVFTAQASDADSDAVSFAWSHAETSDLQVWDFVPVKSGDLSEVRVVVPTMYEDETVIVALTVTDARGAVTIVQHNVAVRAANRLRVTVADDVTGIAFVNNAGETIEADEPGEYFFANDYQRGDGYTIAITQQPENADCLFDGYDSRSIELEGRIEPPLSFSQRIVCNRHPTVEVSTELYAQHGETVELIAIAIDHDGEIADVAWTTDSGVEILNADQQVAEISAPDGDSAMVLEFTVTVTDDDGATASEVVSVNVAAALRISVLPHNVDVPVTVDVHDGEDLVESIEVGSETATTINEFAEGEALSLSLRGVPENEHCTLSITELTVSGDTDQLHLYCDTRPVIVMEDEIEVTNGFEITIDVMIEDDGPEDSTVHFSGMQGEVTETAPGQYEITSLLGGATGDTEQLTVEVTSGTFVESRTMTINVIPAGQIGYPATVYGAQIELYPLAGPFDEPICTRVSSSFEEATSNGLIASMTDCVERGEWYLVAGLGGVTPTTGNRISDLHAVIPGDWLLDHQRWFINHTTELAYQRVAYLISAGYPQSMILSHLDEFAANLLREDLNLDGLIDYLDMLYSSYISQSALKVPSNRLKDLGTLAGKNQLGKAAWIDLLHQPLSSLPVAEVEDVIIANNRAYLLSHDENVNPMSTIWVYNISDPFNPAFEVSYNPTQEGRSLMVFSDGTILNGDNTKVEIFGPHTTTEYEGYECDWMTAGWPQRGVLHNGHYYAMCNDGGMVDIRQHKKQVIALEGITGVPSRAETFGNAIVVLRNGVLSAFTVDRSTFTADLVAVTEYVDPDDSIKDFVKVGGDYYAISAESLYKVTLANNEFSLTKLMTKSIEEQRYGKLQVIDVDGTHEFYIDDRKYAYNSSGQIAYAGWLKSADFARNVLITDGIQVSIFDNPQIRFETDIIELSHPYVVAASNIDDDPLSMNHRGFKVINDHLFTWNSVLTNFRINETGYTENWSHSFTAYQDNCVLEKDEQLYRIHDTGLDIFNAPLGLSSNPVSSEAHIGACPATLSEDTLYSMYVDASVSWIRAEALDTWERHWYYRISESACGDPHEKDGLLYVFCGSELRVLDPDFVEDIPTMSSKQFVPQDIYPTGGKTSNAIFHDNAAHWALNTGMLHTLDFDGVQYDHLMPCEDANILRRDGDRLYAICDNGFAFRFRILDNGTQLEYSIDLPSRHVDEADFSEEHMFFGEGGAIYRYRQPTILLP